jgi:hypothetical protein
MTVYKVVGSRGQKACSSSTFLGYYWTYGLVVTDVISFECQGCTSCVAAAVHAACGADALTFNESIA